MASAQPWRSGAASILLLLGAAGCTDAPSAPGPTRDLAICPFGPGLEYRSGWFAYRNEGGEWTPVSSSDGSYRFKATDRLALATSYVPPYAPFLSVAYLTAEQVAERHACPASVIVPTVVGSVSAVVQGIGAADHAVVRLGEAYAEANVASLTLSLPTSVQPLTLSAVRFPADSLVRIADRVIMRPAQTYAPGATVSVDFTGADAFAPALPTITWSVVPATAIVFFRRAAGPIVQLANIFHPVDGLPPGSHAMPSIPPAQQDSGDMHELLLSTGGNRSLRLYYKAPRDMTVSFGPAAAAPTFTTVATAPHRRIRVDVPSQPEYAAGIAVFAYQSSGAQIVLSVTKEYLGATPATWSLTTPDLSGVAGFPSTAVLAGGPFDWGVSVDNGLYRKTPKPADDGVIYRTAFISGRQP